MRFIKVFIFILLLLTIKSFAQDNDFSLENLKAPSMPSATIIGTQVNEVNKPKSLKAFETAVFSNYLDSDQSLTIPDNYALELNPFMLSGRKNFSYTSYLIDGIPANIWRNLSISVSSTTKYQVMDSTISDAVGFGLRTIILNGKPKQEVIDNFNWHYDKGRRYDNIKADAFESIQNALESDTNSPTNVNDIRKYVLYELKHSIALSENELNIVSEIFSEIHKTTPLDQVEDEFERLFENKYSKLSLKEFKEILQKVKTNRYGFRWEIDLATALIFPTNEFSFSIVPRWGIWSNLSYKSSKLENFTFIGLVRVIFNNDDYLDKYSPIDEDHSLDDYKDVGARLVYEKNRFSLEAEYIHRFNRDKIVRIIDDEEFERKIKNDTHKYVLNVNYNLADNVTVSYNIGKNFDDITTSAGDLITGLSINFGFGDINASDLVKKNE